MTIIVLKEFATFEYFCELKKQWFYTHNDRTYVVDREGVREVEPTI